MNCHTMLGSDIRYGLLMQGLKVENGEIVEIVPKTISFTQNKDIDVDKMVNWYRKYLYEHNASFTYSNIYDFVMDFYKQGILDTLAELKKISK